MEVPTNSLQPSPVNRMEITFKELPRCSFNQPNQSLSVHSAIMKSAPSLYKTVQYIQLGAFLFFYSFTWNILHRALYLLRGRTYTRPGTGVVDGPKLHLWCSHIWCSHVWCTYICCLYVWCSHIRCTCVWCTCVWCTHGRIMRLLSPSSQTDPSGNHNSWSRGDSLL